jgi:hypothetical protein
LPRSGGRANDNARQFAATTKDRWQVVAHIDYSASDVFGVHVWPMTIVVNSDGAIVGHIVG